ncbi:WAT1-related protein At5g47470-like isoform X1 [Typha angustifolia]|uniref:WAT1-related protein At5g47470-like isoform X1 n=1 Tax=Typha angustifolia TaxID=59011 RepID=UPI003C2CA28C
MNDYTETSLAYPSLPSSPLSGGMVVTFFSRRRSPGSTRRDSSSRDLERLPSPSPVGCMEDSLIISGLTAVQLVGAAYMVLLAPLLSLGIKPLFLVTFGSLATSLFTFPFAAAFEKRKWPSRLNVVLMAQFVLIALGGVTTFQALMLVGIKKTSPAIAAAMPNLAPGIIFLIAACLGFEKVDMRCLYTRTKILGTVVCLGGAIAMSILQSPSAPPFHVAERSTVSIKLPLLGNVQEDWIIGCTCLLGAIIVVSCSTVLQAVVMVHFPAPLTLCSVTSFIGAILTAIPQIITEGEMDMGSPVISLARIAALVLLGGMVSGVCVGFQTWAVKKKGPVMVSMFSPTQTVGSAIFSAMILGQVIKLGSVAGMLFLFSGLYMVLWAKKKEGLVPPSTDDILTLSRLASTDIEKPLIS